MLNNHEWPLHHGLVLTIQPDEPALPSSNGVVAWCLVQADEGVVEAPTQDAVPTVPSVGQATYPAGCLNPGAIDLVVEADHDLLWVVRVGEVLLHDMPVRH